MSYFTWFYSEGQRYILQKCILMIGNVAHFFSIPLLLKSLFSPWKRLVAEDNSAGFNLQKALEAFSYNLVSRGIGSVVRTFLILFGLLTLIFFCFVCVLMVILWEALPFWGISAYLRYQRRPDVFCRQLLEQLKTSSHPVYDLFNNEAGRFVLIHTGLSLAKLESAAHSDREFLDTLDPQSYSGLLEGYLNSGVWSDDFFIHSEFSRENLITTAQWWDQQTTAELEMEYSGKSFNQPGIGFDLLFGYTPHLDQYSLSLNSQVNTPNRLIGRDQIISRLERSLNSGNSVVLTGSPGVGKRALILEFARRASLGLLDSHLRYKRILELNFNVALSGATDVNLKKTILRFVFQEAAAAGNVILVIRDLQRLTDSWLEGMDYTDILEQSLEKHDLKIIAIASSSDYERYIYPNHRLRKAFETIEVEPLSKKESLQILLNTATQIERNSRQIITISSIQKILDSSEKYLSDTPFPENALELLNSVVAYKKQQGGKLIGEDDVAAVLAEKTGIPFTRLTADDKAKLANIESIIHERLVDQEMAVSLIGKSLRSRTVGVRDENRPIGSFLFLGPTGVGKTETAKVLASVYYGSQDKILRFDMAEYSGYEGLARLIGSPERKQPGVLTTAIKNRPASLLLLDEIEKSPPEIFNLFLTLLDEGYITDAFGSRISCTNLFVIATSNAGAEYIRELVAKDTPLEQVQRLLLEYVQKNHIFSPEFINRFDGVVVYEPLGQKELIQVSKLMLQSLQKNLLLKDIHFDVTPELCTKLAEDGYIPELGARPMRRIVDIVLGDLIGKGILTGEIKKGSRIKIIPGTESQSYSLQVV
jgi:ATP-dependent Clp protease ATP-binding subunit ClpC